MLFQNYFLFGLAFSVFILVEILMRRFSMQTNTILFVYKRTAITLLFSIAWLMVSGTITSVPNTVTIFQLSGCALLMALGLWCFVEANKHLSLSNLLSVQMIGLIVKLLVSENLFSQQSSLLVYLSLFISLVGLFLHVSLPENRIGIIWTLLSTLGWTFGYEYMFSSFKVVGAPWTLVIVEGCLMVWSILFLLLRKQGKQIGNLMQELDTPTVIIALLSTLCVLVLSYAAKYFEIGTVSLLNICIYPVSIFLVRAIFNEVVLNREWIGNALIFSGLLCFYIFSH